MLPFVLFVAIYYPRNSGQFRVLFLFCIVFHLRYRNGDLLCVANCDKEKEIVSIVVNSDPAKQARGKKGQLRAEMQQRSGHHALLGMGTDALTAIDQVPTSTNRTKCVDGMVVSYGVKQTKLQQYYCKDEPIHNDEQVVAMVPQIKLEAVGKEDEHDLLIDTDYDNDTFEEDIDDR